VFDEVELSGPLPLVLNSTAVPGTVIRFVLANAAVGSTKTVTAVLTMISWEER
jgi:hypothetical protein